MTLWVSLYLMTLHTQITHTHTHATNSRFVTSFYSDYWTEWVITRARWEEGGGLLIGQKRDRPVWQRDTEKEMETERRIDKGGGAVVWMEREREKDGEEEGGVTWASPDSWLWHLRPSRLAAHSPFVMPPSSPSTFFSCSLHLPHWSAVKVGKTVWEGYKTNPFSLDAVLCQACGDTFKDEGEVNVVGRMRELL